LNPPKKAQYIVKQLEDPANSKVNYRSAYFVGEPGTGKTMMAKAIAYKMAQKGWTCKRLSSCELIGKYRHETGMRLENLLETAAASDKPTLIIIDDLNLLLEHTGSKYHDTAETAAILWDFLNRENNNEKLFFIGTMYRANKLPEYYKNRMMSNGIYFPLITNPKFINKLIRKTLTTQHTHLDKAVTDSFLNETLAKIGPCSARALTLMSENIFFMLEENDEKKSIPITKAHIERAIKEYMLVKKTMDS